MCVYTHSYYLTTRPPLLVLPQIPHGGVAEIVQLLLLELRPVFFPIYFRGYKMCILCEMCVYVRVRVFPLL